MLDEEEGGQLLAVAEFAWIPPEGVSSGVKQPAAGRAVRQKKFSELLPGLQQDALDENGFFSGMVVSDDPVALGIIKEQRIEEQIVEPQQQESASAIKTNKPNEPQQQESASAIKTNKPNEPQQQESASTIVKPKRQGVVPTVRPRQTSAISVLGSAVQKKPGTSFEFATKDGIHFRGLSKDVSLNGLNVSSDMDLSRLKAKEHGRLQLVSTAGTHQFPCEVMEVSESDITLKLFSGDHTFEKQAKAKMFEDLHRDHSALKQEHQTLISRSQQVSGPGGEKERNDQQ